MAELHLVIPYKSLPGNIILGLMTALFPLWSIVAPCWLGYFIGNTLRNPQGVSAEAILLNCLGLFTLILLSIFVTALAEDNRIHVSRDGISFPLYLLPRLKFKRRMDWNELREAGLISENTVSASLLLAFKTGTTLSLKLCRIAKSDLEQMLLALELCSPDCHRSEPLIALQRKVQNEGRAEGNVGHTKMWEEELSRRFSATTFTPLEPATKLQNGHLEIIRQLAFGGLSAIYLAQQNKRDLVVLKESVVPAGANVEAKTQAEAHLKREAMLLTKLSHPNIASVLDHFVEDGRHYILLEYVKGQDLRQYIKQNGVVSQKQAIEWGIKLAEILIYLHGQVPPVIHRDLTPDNIVLTNDGQLVLIDFGAANQFVGTATGTIVGKQAYIPAEQLRGKTVPQSDLYALAGTIYFLLTGQDPKALSDCRPKLLNGDLSTELDELLSSCSAFEPGDRLQTATEFADSLRKIGNLNSAQVMERTLSSGGSL